VTTADIDSNIYSQPSPTIWITHTGINTNVDSATAPAAVPATTDSNINPNSNIKTGAGTVSAETPPAHETSFDTVFTKLDYYPKKDEEDEARHLTGSHFIYLFFLFLNILLVFCCLVTERPLIILM
jgi:hypothetical protein